MRGRGGLRLATASMCAAGIPQTVTVRRRAAGTFPTYWVIDEWGDSWWIAQIELSSSPITTD
jgi:hypothetical protein